ncbi:ABC transporter ATP-binding protein [Cohnella lubricantis]|uniref:ABC transporter ATP-binding protein n=1 Tax=Cohnella lubricantis TaxID=2163172 RepID=A0A841THX7_9BACL|nr:ABC transporter ATP-binding protein [Cohnella lubricantis]MBB6679499.1 ABC transporter ATP-binding protein [Cohnella lubricantis]MBP2118091.1 ATP-binding cassette subfamily B protein [Cohnella lubricantis]
MPPSTNLSMSWFIQYLRPVKWRMLALFLLLLAATAMQLVQPIIVERFIDMAIAQGALNVLLSLAGVYLAVAVANQLVTVTVDYLGNDVAWRSTNRIRSSLLRHCLRLDMRFHNLKTPGEMIERIDGDVIHMSNFFANFIVQIAASAILLIGILGYMFMINWPIALTMTVFTLLAIGVMLAIRNVGVASSQAERQASAELFGLIEERIAGIEDVQANGGVPRLMNRYHRAMRAVFRSGRRAWMHRVTPWNTTVALYTLAVTAVMLMGVRLYMNDEITLGTLFLIYQYTSMLNDPIEQIGDRMQDFQKAKSGMRRSRELLSLRSEIADGADDTLPDGPLGVSFENVDFGYNEDKQVLHGISFELRPGERLGLVGRTGSGKSSISRLLLRLYNINGGTIRIGGKDIRSLRMETLYGKVGMVTQDVQLFDGSLRDNLTLFNPELTDEMILETTGRLGLKQWIDAMPEGLDTPISTGGTSLSAGEAQLFALTRVFLTKPSLVILDEPSSRLDAATEAALQSAVDQLLSECTGIVIAHRLSTLDSVDKILVLQGGHVVEFGAREELAKRPDSHYGRLLRTNNQEELA